MRTRPTPQTPQHEAIKFLHDIYGSYYLDKATTAKILGIGTATVDRMREAGEIKSSKIRGSVKFSLSEIAKFI